MKLTIKISLEVDISYPDAEENMKLNNRLMRALTADIPERLSFEELDNIFYFQSRQYYVKSADFSDLNRDDDESISNFKIIG